MLTNCLTKCQGKSNHRYKSITTRVGSSHIINSKCSQRGKGTNHVDIKDQEKYRRHCLEKWKGRFLEQILLNFVDFNVERQATRWVLPLIMNRSPTRFLKFPVLHHVSADRVLPLQSSSLSELWDLFLCVEGPTMLFLIQRSCTPSQFIRKQPKARFFNIENMFPVEGISSLTSQKESDFSPKPSPNISIQPLRTKQRKKYKIPLIYLMKKAIYKALLAPS